MNEIIEFLNLHHQSFFLAHPYANRTEQPTPEDSRAWSQILVSLLTGINGLGRKKGTDLLDGSDVKAANTWGAIDTPRFNGCIKAGTNSHLSDRLESLDTMPYLFFVLWDNEPVTNHERTRVWCVRTQFDPLFRGVCERWYNLRSQGIIKSNNFQLHPPRNLNSNRFSNNCGNLNYPLLLSAVWNGLTYNIESYNPDVLTMGTCSEDPIVLSINNEVKTT